MERSAQGFFSDVSESVTQEFLNAEWSGSLGRRFGDYELIEEIARGGMGVVYKARQVSLDRLVAVKMLLFGALASKDFIQRFRVEASAAASLRHPHIVAVHEVGVHQDQHYLVMDYIAGPTLAQLCGGQPVAPKRAAAYVRTIAQAIQFAHEHGVLHRDLKPSNVLVDHEDQPHITDFGMAKRQDLDSSLTLTGQLLGTPGYMAPELAGGQRGKVGRPTDVYSLGAILFYLLTGRPPFVAETIADTIQMVLEREPLTPGALVVGIPKDLETICLKCLRKEPEKRYGTAQELADELERFLNNEPIRARRTTRVEKLWRWCRRHPAVATLAAATSILALAVLVGSPIAVYRIDKARQAETSARTQSDHSLYIAKINLMQREWDRNNIRRVQQLLNQTADYPERGFEWYYWKRLTHLNSKTLSGHTKEIWSIAYSPDGSRVVTGSGDKTAKVWDADSGKELMTLTGHRDTIYSVAYSPDGRKIITGSVDETARIWDAESGMQLYTLRGEGFHRDFLLVAFSHDGRRIFTGCSYGTVWDANSYQRLFTLKSRFGSVRGVAFSPDDKRIVTGSRAPHDGLYRIWDAASGKELVTLNGNGGDFAPAAFSPDGERIFTGGNDGIIRVWETSTGKALFSIPGHSDEILSLAVSPDGKRIVTGSDDRTAKVWDAATGKMLFVLKDTVFVRSVAFSPDGKSIVTCSSEDPFTEHSAKIWHANENWETLKLENHQAEVNSVAFSPDGRRIVTGSKDRTAKVWDVTSGKELFTLLGHTNNVMGVAISRDGQRIATGSTDCTARIWDAVTGKSLFILRCPDMVDAVAFTPDGRRVGTGGENGSAIIWDVANGNELFTLKGHRAVIWALVFSQDGRRILTCDGLGWVMIWDAPTGQELRRIKTQNLWTASVAFSPDGERFVAGGQDRTAKVWDVSTGKRMLTLEGQGDQIWGVAYSPDGKRIATGGVDGVLKIWEANSGQELLSLPGHPAEVRSVAFSPDGTRVVSGSWDHSARIWTAATSEQVIAWDREDKESEAHLELERKRQADAAKRERVTRAQDEGDIKKWLVLGPIHFGTNSGPTVINQEQIPNEPNLRPRASEITRIGTNDLMWKSALLEDDLLDFEKIEGNQKEASLGYAICYIVSDADQTNLCAYVGNDDECKIYLNGKVIFQQDEYGTYSADSSLATGIDLKRGLNVLVVKLTDEVNTMDGWRVSVRFTDATGQQVSGIKVKLDPSGNE
jgi:WD40 repeat protein